MRHKKEISDELLVVLIYLLFTLILIIASAMLEALWNIWNGALSKTRK